jgi:hypothetical protein
VVMTPAPCAQQGLTARGTQQPRGGLGLSGGGAGQEKSISNSYPLEFVLPRERPLDTLPQRADQGIE